MFDLSVVVNEIYNMIFSEGLLIVVACYVFGNIITKCTKIDNNKTVPILSLIGGFLMFVIPTVYSADTIAVRFIKGIILGWSSTGLHELLKALSKYGIIKIPGYNNENNNGVG